MPNTPPKDEPQVLAPGAVSDDLEELDFTGSETEGTDPGGTPRTTQLSRPRIAARGRATRPVRPFQDTQTAAPEIDPALLRPTVPEPRTRFPEEPDLRPTEPMAKVGLEVQSDVRVATDPEGTLGQVEPLLEKESRLQQDVVYGAIVCEGPEDEVRAILGRYASEVKLIDGSGRAKTWSIGIYGERPTVPSTTLAQILREYANEHRYAPPTTFFKGDTRDIRLKSAGIPVDALAPVITGYFSNSAVRGKDTYDQGFNLISRHNRDAGYNDIRAGRTVQIQAGDTPLTLHIAESFRPMIRALNVAGAERMVGRDKEMAESTALFKEAFKSGGFRMLMVKGEAYMGKSRLAQELIKEIQAGNRHARVLFAPAMDFNKNGPRSYLSTFVNVLLDKTPDLIAGFTASDEYISLILFAQNPDGYKREDIVRALSVYMKKVSESGVPFVFVMDDSQWIDSESSQILSQVFDQKGELRHTSVLMLSRIGDEMVAPELRRHQNKQVFLKGLNFVQDGKVTPPMWNLVCDLLKVNPAHAQIDSSVLIRLAEKSGGNPGVLTSMLHQLCDAGVVKVHGSHVVVDLPEFVKWESAGSADAALKNEIERLCANPQYREVLSYVVAFADMGDFDWSLISLFFDKYLKKPELIRVMSDLRQREIISINQRGVSDYIFIPREKFVMLFKSDVGVGEKGMKNAYRMVAKFAHGRRAQVIQAGYKTAEQLKAYFAAEGNAHCGAFAIYTYGEKAGSPDIQEMYALEAFDEAYASKNYVVMLRIYEFVIARPDLHAQVLQNWNFKLKALEAMKTVGGEKWLYKSQKIMAEGKEQKQYSPGEAEKLGEELKAAFYSEFQTLGTSKNIERLCELMVDLYYARSLNADLLQESANQMIEWWKFYIQNILQPLVGSGKISSLEMRLADYIDRFNRARITFAKKQYSDAQTDFGLLVQSTLTSMLQDRPEMTDALEGDPRYIRVRMEALRMLANSYFNAYMKVPVEICEVGKDVGETMGEFSDINACDTIAVEAKGSSLHANLSEALKYCRQFIEMAEKNPELLYTPAKYLFAWQLAGNVSGFLREYNDSFEYLMGARSMALKSGDFGNFGQFTINLASMLCDVVEVLNSGKASEEVWAQARKLATTLQLERSAPTSGELDDNQMVAWILECAQYYVYQGTDHLAGNNEALRLLGLLNGVEILLAKGEALAQGIIKPDTQFRKEVLLVKEIVQEFINQFEDLGKKFGPAYWDFYGAPLIARLGLLLDRVAEPEQSDDLLPDPQKVITDAEKKEFIQAIFDLHDEEGRFIGYNPRFAAVMGSLYRELTKFDRGLLPPYAQAVYGKIRDIEKFLLSTLNPVEREKLTRE